MKRQCTELMNMKKSIRDINAAVKQIFRMIFIFTEEKDRYLLYLLHKVCFGIVANWLYIAD